MDYLVSHQFNDVTIICTDGNSEYFNGASYPVLVDTDAEIERLNLRTQNVALLTTDKRRLEQIISLQANNLDSMLIAYFSQED